MINIVHIILQPRFSGAEILVREMSKELARHDNIHTHIISIHPSIQDFDNPSSWPHARNCTLHFPDTPHHPICRLITIRRILSKIDNGIIFYHTQIPAFYGRIASWGLRHKSFLTLHTAGGDEYHNARFLMHYTEKLALSRMLSGLITICAEGALGYSSYIQSRIPSTVIGNGIDINRFSMGKKQPTATTEGISILQVGRIYSIKRQIETILAFNQILTAIPANAQLNFVGPIEDADYHKKCLKLVSQLNISDRVKFHGTTINIETHYTHASCVVMPSQTEAQGLAAVEALASGAPLVLSNISQFNQFKGYEGVFSCDPTNTIEYATALLLAIQSNSPHLHRNLKAYTISTCTSKYIRFASQCLSAFKS